MVQEFLPICDVLFNIVSMASYFCDIVFDVITAYTLYASEQYIWLGTACFFIILSILSSQILSARLFLQHAKGLGDIKECDKVAVILIHYMGFGLLWRYFKLFIPVDVRFVKTEVRDLCLLRLVHAFVQAAPMLLLQLYLIWLKNNPQEVTDLNVVSTVLSLFSVCWALASFNKNIRKQDVHKLVLTWLGVIFQFFWRLGMVTSRAIALTVYATVYAYWVFLVISLHWMCMFLWLISPKSIFQGDKLHSVRRDLYCALIALIYVFCYVNFQETQPRLKMTAFYVTMFLENTLLMAVWLIGVHDIDLWYKHMATAIMFSSFFIGIGFMALYYRYFHVKKLKYVNNNSGKCNYCQKSACTEHSEQFACSDYTSAAEYENTKDLFDKRNMHVHGIVPAPGVFNCRFNPGMMRKRKKPTSFVPPPAPVVSQFGFSPDKSSQPFWKRPPSRTGSFAGSVSSRVDIQQKLQEKKRQQLAELQVIEEEIKQGKLKRPPASDISESGTLMKPIPHAKKQPWFSPPSPTPMSRGAQQLRAHTPEILLSPHYLGDSRGYNYYDDSDIYNGYSFHPDGFDPYGDVSALEESASRQGDKVPYKTYRIPSDVDSQVSLPRSYTLPREFKYKRPKPRRTVKNEHFITSTNSSDGDVDSGDDLDIDDEDDIGVLEDPSPSRDTRIPQPFYAGRSRHFGHWKNLGTSRHETKF